jgi:hypothetical protein
MQDAKLIVKLKSSAYKNKSLSATLPGNGARKVLDNPKKYEYRSVGARRKNHYSLQLECHNSCCLCTKLFKVTTRLI